MVRKNHSSLYHGNANKSHNFFASLKHAIRGIAFAILFEANFRRQIIILVVALLAAFWLNLSLWLLVAMLLAGISVIAFELTNSAIESLIDAVHPDYSEHIQRAKDMMAAAVLLVSIAALALAIAVFVPTLIIKFSLLQ